jgi:subtilase family serine protease
VDRAALLGATQISNSYGGGEFSTETTSQSHYNHPGIDITVSSGDSGYGVEFPAASQYVTAVGGTTLNRSSNSRGWTETVWNGAGSGCSAYVSKPSWQTDTGCSGRTVADQSAVADPNTGVAVYDSFAYGGASGWLVFGGTSVAAPVVAGVDAIAGGRAGSATPYGSFPYSNVALFNDVVSGSNGSCGGTYLCSGKVGYDGPTGIGTPNGAGAPPSNSAPANTSKPTISGNTTQGQTLTASPGTWTGYPAPTYGYNWQRCNPTCGDTGVTGTSYPLTSNDVGATIQVVVTATNTVGSSSATSDQTAQIAAPAADFTLSASPSSQSIRRGQSTTYTVTVNAVNGFTSGVNFSVSGLPAGATFTMVPGSPGSPGSVTINTSSNGPWGTWSPVITGTSGTLSHTTSVTLNVRKK